MSAQPTDTPDQLPREELATLVEDRCATILATPQRSNHVKPRRLKEDLSQHFPAEVSADARGIRIGRVLQDAAYAEKWGDETYTLDADTLLDDA